ncbi:aminotransferase class I/II-fold pyridoxal phosphate-dependent enzyme [Reichenbachiella versicolor]|uniref:aminotransferase class I/II-fold pyridoxal phosphate-dependent enzyme n=1 Tax=Reichenbachiella versicolor TaxID=1821036 RepID=UPI000D6E059B|nr:pyridoxal phosphate-dependent aminotransferase family protein [Reichenbachiella versicolor]
MKLKIFDKLEERKLEGSLRTLKNYSELIDFVSNDYLGLSRSEELFHNINKTSSVYLNGSTGSRLLAGNQSSTTDLENKLAKLFNTEATLLFNSGYVANLALISTIPQRSDTIIYDSLSHVCLKEGAKLSKAQSYSFKHNDIEDLERKLNNATGEKFVVIESVYSMDGDKAEFGPIIELAKKHNAHLIVDEAHSTGMYGDQGQGLVCDLGIETEFFARVYTFGKAMGVHGAAIAGGQQLIDYLINFARPFIYTTALPPHSVKSIDEAFKYIESHNHLQQTSQDKISLFKKTFEEKIGDSDSCYKMDSNTPIQPIVVPGNERVKFISSELQSLDFDVRPILSPTVKKDSERLRISIHTYNTDQQIIELVEKLSSLL